MSQEVTIDMLIQAGKELGLELAKEKAENVRLRAENEQISREYKAMVAECVARKKLNKDLESESIEVRKELATLREENTALQAAVDYGEGGIKQAEADNATLRERLAAAEGLVRRFYNYHTSSWSTEFSMANFMMMLLADVEAWIPPSTKGEGW